MPCADGLPCSAERVAADQAPAPSRVEDNFWDTIEDRIHASKLVMDKENRPPVKPAPQKKTYFRRAAQKQQAKEPEQAAEGRRSRVAIDRQDAFELRKQGATLREIADTLGTSQGTVSRALTGEMGSMTITPELEAQVRAELISGNAMYATAKKHGISWYHVNKIAMEAGIPTRKIEAVQVPVQSLEPKPSPTPAPVPPACKRDSRCQYMHGHKSPCMDRQGNWLSFENGPIIAKFDESPVIKPEQRSIVIDDQQSAGIDALLRADQGGTRVSINIEISDADAINIFSKLSADHKGEALKAVIEASLRH